MRKTTGYSIAREPLVERGVQQRLVRKARTRRYGREEGIALRYVAALALVGSHGEVDRCCFLEASDCIRCIASAYQGKLYTCSGP